MNISFAHTTPALLAGRKTVTRRAWKPMYFRQWLRAWEDGRHVHQAYDKSPRVGGRCVGTITLTAAPRLERLADMPEADLAAEGGLWSSKAEFVQAFVGQGLGPTDKVAVIRFTFHPLTAA